MYLLVSVKKEWGHEVNKGFCEYIFKNPRETLIPISNIKYMQEAEENTVGIWLKTGEVFHIEGNIESATEWLKEADRWKA